MAARKKQITFWVSDEESKAINLNAKAYHLGVSDYLRRLGMSGANPFSGLTLAGGKVTTMVQEQEDRAGQNKEKERRHGQPRIGYWKNQIRQVNNRPHHLG